MMSPEQHSWFPSCVVKLTIRFDESLQVAGTGEGVSSKEIEATSQEDRAAQGKRPRRALREPVVTIGSHATVTSADGTTRTVALGPVRARANDALSELDETRSPYASGALDPAFAAVANESGSRRTDPPNTVPLTYGTDKFTVIANRVPKRGVFTLPHPRTAATFTLIFDYLEFPVDPRMIRAVGVEVHLGTVSASDYARGMAGEKDPHGRPLSVLKTTTDQIDPSGRPAVNKATLLFYGTCDTWDVEHGEGGSTVQLKGRDIRGIFIDGKPPLSKIAKIDLDKPIDRVVQDILSTMGTDADLRMTVSTDEAEWPEGVVPSPGDAEGLTRVRLKAGGEGSSSTPATGGKTSYWDLITNYCTLVGAMPQIVGSTIWIRPIHRIFDVVARRSTIATPFAGGQPRRVGREAIRVRRLVFGRDLKRLSFSRKFGGVVVPAIQCISYDDRAVGTQRLIFGQWPPEETITAKTKGTDEVLRVPMYGVRSVEQLTRIAHGIYEEIGRGETGGQAETKNLASLGGDNADPDILRLRPMDPIEFMVDARALRTIAPVVSEVNEAARRTFSEEVDVLHRRIGDRLVARALVALARGAVRELLTFYQVTGVEYEFGNGGVRTTIAFQNYIVPRQQVTEDRTPAPPEVRSSAVDVVGAHKKSKVREPRVSIGPATITDADGNTRTVDITQRVRRPRNLKEPRVTIGPATGTETP